MPTPLIGRETELADVAAFVDRLGERPAALLLHGEAGIGKTTLWQAGVEQVEAGEVARLLSCRPAESESELSFSALGDLLGPVVDVVVLELPDPQRRALEVALLLDDEGPSDVDRRTVSAAVLGSLRILSRLGPVLIAIDDVQWIDPPTSWSLEFAVRRLVDEPVSLLLAQRTNGSSSTPLALDRALGDRLTDLRLGPLTVGAIHHLIHQRLGASLPRPTLVRLHEACGGNPFYALEIARQLLERDEPLAASEALPVPPTLQGLLAGRLERLSAAARETLLAAAVASHPTVALLGETLGDEQRALADLSEATRSGVVAVATGRVTFTHPLLASTLISEAALGDLRRVHRSLAQTVADPEGRARHLALASDGRNEATAVVLDAAARQARARGAPAVAAEFGELALMKTPEDQVDGYIRRAIAAADDLVDSADGIRAKRVLDAACAIAQPGQLRAAVLRRIGFLTRDQAEARGLLDRALAEAEGDHASLASAHSALAILDLVVGDIPSAVEHSRRALSEAELTDDSSLQAEATAQVLMSRIMHGERISDALVARAIALDHDVDRAPMWGKPAAAVGYLALCRGDLVAARRFIESALTRSALKGDDLGRCEMLIFAVMLECRAGDFSTAAGYAREATEIAEENGLDHLMESVHFATSFAASHLGDVRLAREAGLKGFETANRLGHTGFMISGRCVIGFLELSLGDLAAAEDWLGPVPELMRDMGAIEPGIFRHAPDLIEAQVGLGYLDRAEEELSRLEAIAEELEHPWARAVALRSRALLCAARGDQAGADAAIEQGLRAHEAIPEPFELARMHLVAGTIHRRSKRKRAAREELELALTDFERMQTPLWADKARAELARVGRRAAEPQGLSPTEQRISELVASGRTNREIADELFLSLRTVEANLTRTYRKLGVRSRTELVRRRTESSG